MQQPSPQSMDRDASIVRFSDEDDLRLFELCSGPYPLAKILPIKHNDPTVKCIEWEHVYLNNASWRRLGDILGQNTHLEKLVLKDCRGDVEAVGAGLQRNRSIQVLELYRIDLENGEKMDSLAPFLTHNPCLKRIVLPYCRLGPASIDILANALSNGPGNILEELNLGNNSIGDNVDGLIQALSESKCLRKLSFYYCGVGPTACALLATLLGNPESNLSDLDLRGFSIDNESTITLAGSLVNNKKLRFLGLRGNIGIAAGGWSAMLRLVFDSSSIENLINCNQVLHSLGYPMKREFIRALGSDGGSLLCASLKLNEGGNKLLIARRKIIWAHARGDLNLGQASIAGGAMPRILAWIANDSNESDARIIQYSYLEKTEIGIVRLGGVYRIIQSMPELCNRKQVPHQEEVNKNKGRGGLRQISQWATEILVSVRQRLHSDPFSNDG